MRNIYIIIYIPELENIIEKFTQDDEESKSKVSLGQKYSDGELPKFWKGEWIRRNEDGSNMYGYEAIFEHFKGCSLS